MTPHFREAFSSACAPCVESQHMPGHPVWWSAKSMGQDLATCGGPGMENRRPWLGFWQCLWVTASKSSGKSRQGPVMVEAALGTSAVVGGLRPGRQGGFCSVLLLAGAWWLCCSWGVGAALWGADDSQAHGAVQGNRRGLEQKCQGESRLNLVLHTWGRLLACLCRGQHLSCLPSAALTCLSQV